MRTIFFSTLFILVAQPLWAAPQQFGLPALPRATFNQLAIQANLPLFWTADKNNNKLIDIDELAVQGFGKTLQPWIQGEKFTPRFITGYKELVELKRRGSVAKELAAGRPTMIRSDFSAASPADKALLKNLLAAAYLIEELYLHQTGGFKYWRQSAKLDPASRTLFWRNHGPWCNTSATKGNPFCSASQLFPAKRSEAYPEEMAQDDAMCKTLQNLPNAKELLDPFTVVKRINGNLVAVPIHKVFNRKMKMVANHLMAAAEAIKKDPTEAALYSYLLAAAMGFTTNDWAKADEAWVAMNSTNSQWYLRVGPDEVYFDPCQQKAGFHMSLARIDKGSLKWQKLLTPHRSLMERSFAQLIGAPYKAREVRFHMPDFIHIVLNAGDSRHSLGATIGQSLPNWGKVAQEGRGRTVVMSNLYTDPDSLRIQERKARALLSKASLAYFTSDPEPFLVNIILHEATHNFGPHSDFRIKGKQAKEIFGGKTASILEELKAQTGGMWYLELLRKKGLLTDLQLKQAYTDCVLWAFGHISQGMVTPSGNVRPYSQLAAIQMGFFMEQGALSFKHGKFTIHLEKLPAAVAQLAKKVGQIKANGDKNAAEQMIAHYIQGRGLELVHEKYVAKKFRRFSKASFLYSVIY